jgi:hypothetical protein
VTFTYKDYSQGGRVREMALPVEEFIRRFLLHVLPESSCPDSLLRPAVEPPSQGEFGSVPRVALGSADR